MKYKFNSNAIKLVAGQCLTQILDRALLVVIIWYIVQNYNKIDVAIFLGVTTIPYFFALGFSSIVINKIGPIKVVYFSDLIRALWLLGIFICLGHVYTVVELILVLFVSNCLASLFDPAILSLPPLIVSKEKAHKLTAWLNICVSLGAIVGPVGALVVAHWIGLRGLFLLSAFSYLIAGLLELSIKLPSATADGRSEEIIKTKDYIKLMLTLDLKIYLFLIMGILINLLFMPLQLFVPVYVHHVQNSGIALYTNLQIAMGVGAISGALLISFFSKLSNRLSVILILTFYLLSSLFYMLFSLGGSFNLSLISVFGIDCFMSAGNVMLLSLYQKVASRKQLPFIMSCVMFVSVAIAPLAMLLAGFAVNYYSIKPVIEFYSLLSFVLMLIILCVAMVVVKSKFALSWRVVSNGS